jgi:hypothetical protein
MCVAVWKDYCVTSRQLRSGFAIHLYVALAFGNQMEDHHALGPGLKKRRRNIRVGRLVTPRCGKPPIDENRTNKAHNAQRFGQCVH